MTSYESGYTVGVASSSSEWPQEGDLVEVKGRTSYVMRVNDCYQVLPMCNANR